MADSVVTIGADLSELRRELAKMPNQASEAGQKTLIALERTVKRAEKAAKRAIRTTNKANKQAARDAEKAAKDARDGFKGIVELAGASGDKLDKFSAVFGALSNPIGVVTVGLTAAGVAAVGAVAGVVQLVQASAELAEELEPYHELEGFEGLSPAAIDTVLTANAALDSLGVIAKRMVVTLGNEFAPVVEQGARLLLKLGLAGMDALQGMADGTDLLREGFVFMGQVAVRALVAPVDGLLQTVGLLGDLATALGADGVGGALTGVRDEWDGFTRSISEAGVDLLFDGVGNAVDGLNLSLGDYDDRVDALIGTTKRLTREQTQSYAETQRAAEKKTTTDERSSQEAEKAALAEEKARARAAKLVSSLTRGRLSEIEQLNLAEREALAELEATQVATEEQRLAVAREFAQRRVDIERDAARKTRAEQLTQAREYASSVSSIVGETAQSAYQLAEMLSEKSKQEALGLFRVYQAAAISQAVIDGALAISNIWSTFAAAPPVAAALTALAVANTGVQIAAIASEKPSFAHRGAFIRPGVSTPTPDEQDRRVRAREAVLNPGATRRIGGEAGVARLNAGLGMSNAPLVAVVEHRNRYHSAAARDASRREGSPVRMSRVGGRRYGR